MGTVEISRDLYEESKFYLTCFKNRLRYMIFEGGLDSAINKAVKYFYEGLSPDDPVLKTSSELFKENVISHLEKYKCGSIDDAIYMEYRLSRAAEWHWKIRQPEVPEVIMVYYRFLGEYEIEHPPTPFIEAQNACMQAHPEWWPKTLPQN